jgi:pimeloyl-ACP methyl ester carboxylesterase
MTTSTSIRPRLRDAGPTVARSSRDGRRRERVARLERPLLRAGLALVALHLLDLAFSGPDTSLPGVLAIIAAPAAWALAQPHVTRPTRVVLAVLIGLLTFGFGVVSHGLHVVNSGPDWSDATGVAMIAGGLLLVGAGLTAVTAPRRPSRRPALGWRAAHGVAWLAAVPIFAVLAVGPFAIALMTTHAPRWAIQESSLTIPHQQVVIKTANGGALSGWYVPSHNRAAVLLSHGSGGSRERVTAHIRMLARHGYGVLALDNPGNGESHGHSNALGYNVQPAIDTALRWLTRRPDVDPRRIAGFGTSLGAEVLLEAAAHHPQLRAVVADGPTRPQDGQRVHHAALPERALTGISLQAIRAISGTREAPSLIEIMPRIAPRPVLLIASGRGAPTEIPANRAYRDAGGARTQLWELPDTGHTAGLRTHPTEYEQRTTGFLDQALKLKDST